MAHFYRFQKARTRRCLFRVSLPLLLLSSFWSQLSRPNPWRRATGVMNSSNSFATNCTIVLQSFRPRWGRRAVSSFCGPARPVPYACALVSPKGTTRHLALAGVKLRDSTQALARIKWANIRNGAPMSTHELAPLFSGAKDTFARFCSGPKWARMRPQVCLLARKRTEWCARADTQRD